MEGENKSIKEPEQISKVSRRIATNTLLLYGRMIFLLLISLYTSRVVLNALGQSDFGIYNVVGGIVAMMAIISGALTNAVSRFLTFELGKTQGQQFNKVFSTAVLVQVMLILLLAIVAEPICIWYVNSPLDLPPDRMVAANWVLQCAVLTFFVNLLSVPYSGAIIAHERMGAFAYISVFEGIINLLIAVCISHTGLDKLILYAVLMVLVKVIIRLVNGIYCRRHFPETKFRFVWDTSLLKRIFKFTGWLALGNGMSVINTNGINLLINKFFGVTLNAATGLAAKVESSVSGFVNNFITAINPQITKSYAAGNIGYMHDLMCKGAKFSYLIIYFFALPIILEAPSILDIWLKGNVPDYTVALVRITLLSAMFKSLGNTVLTGINATGKVRNYQIAVSTVAFFAFPLSWLAFRMGAEPYVAFLILMGVDFTQIFVRLIVTRKDTGLTIRKFFNDVIWRILKVSIAAAIVPLVIWNIQEPSIWRTMEVCLVSFICVIAASYMFAATDGEKAFITNKISNILHKRNGEELQ